MSKPCGHHDDLLCGCGTPMCGTEPDLARTIIEELTTMTQNARRGCQLGPHQLRRLDLACIPIHEAWGTPYLVGSAMTRPDFRDVDVRLLLEDDEFDRLFPGGADDYGTRTADHALNYLNAAISFTLTQASGLHHIGKEVDFQFQRRTEANARWDDLGEYPRNPLGNRWLR